MAAEQSEFDVSNQILRSQERSWQEITRCLLYQIIIQWNHLQGANLIFLLGFCPTWKMHYVWGLSVLYFKSDEVSFQDQGFTLEGISTKHIDCLKAKIVNIIALRPKTIKVRPLLFFSFLASRPRYWRFVFLTSLNAWLKSPLRKITVPVSWLQHF